jgi:hypothetical protein
MWKNLMILMTTFLVAFTCVYGDHSASLGSNPWKRDPEPTTAWRAADADSFAGLQPGPGRSARAADGHPLEPLVLLLYQLGRSREALIILGAVLPFLSLVSGLIVAIGTWKRIKRWY